jgi:hypothetical protein
MHLEHLDHILYLRTVHWFKGKALLEEGAEAWRQARREGRGLLISRHLRAYKQQVLLPQNMQRK